MVPLSCQQGILGIRSKRVVLAHFAATALRTTPAVNPMTNACFPSVWVAIWALITYLPDLYVAGLTQRNAGDEPSG